MLFKVNGDYQVRQLLTNTAWTAKSDNFFWHIPPEVILQVLEWNLPDLVLRKTCQMLQIARAEGNLPEIWETYHTNLFNCEGNLTDM